MNKDNHINMFLPYFSKREFHEDNITRALLLTISACREVAANTLLDRVPETERAAWKTLLQSQDLEVGLQSCPVATLGGFKQRRLVAISKNPERFFDHSKLPSESNPEFGSRPDGWLYSRKTSLLYCFETKLGMEYDYEQLARHLHLLNLGPEDCFPLSWDTIYEYFDTCLSDTKCDHCSSLLIGNFLEYLKMNGLNPPHATRALVEGLPAAGAIADFIIRASKELGLDPQHSDVFSFTGYLGYNLYKEGSCVVWVGLTLEKPHQLTLCCFVKGKQDHIMIGGEKITAQNPPEAWSSWPAAFYVDFVEFDFFKMSSSEQEKFITGAIRAACI